MKRLHWLLPMALLLSPIAAAGAKPPHIGPLKAGDLDGKFGDCGLYLNRADGELILFNDSDDPTYMKIDGKVVHLSKQFPLQGDKWADAMTIYSAGDGYIQVGDNTHVIEELNYESHAVAGTLTVIVGGISQTLSVTGTSGC